MRDQIFESPAPIAYPPAETFSAPDPSSELDLVRELRAALFLQLSQRSGEHYARQHPSVRRADAYIASRSATFDHVTLGDVLGRYGLQSTGN